MRSWHANPWVVLVTLSLGFFMTLLDLTIVNIAIPSMIDQLDASLDEVLWVLNAYVLVLAVLLITAGRLGDLRGQRTLFMAGVALFTVASLLCGVSQSPSQLIAARVLQAVGAATLMPQTMAIIIATFPADRRGTALGVWGAVAGLATVAGPTLGGLLVTQASWRWIFFVNVPIGVLVLAMTALFVPDRRIPRRHRLDLVGVLVATAGMFCFSFALTEGQRFEWNAWILLCLALSAVFLVVFLLQQRRTQDSEPLVPFRLFESRNFAVYNVIGAAVSVSVLAFFLPMTIYLQSVLGYSALKAGLVLAPSSVVSMVVAPVAGRLSDRLGGKFLLFAGLLAFAGGATWLVAVADVGTAWPVFVAPLVLAGIGMGAIFAPLATEAMRSVPPQLAGAASGLNTTVRQVGSLVGSAAIGALIQHNLATSLLTEARRSAASLPEAYRERFVAGFGQATRGGLELGAGQTGAAQHLGAGVPEQVAAQLHEAAAGTFHRAFVDALPWTMALPVLVALLAAGICLLARGHRATLAAAAAAAPPGATISA